MKTLTLGFSPCPNDTFIFDALVNDKIDTGSLQFDPVLADVEELNEKAFNEELDITKLSYHAFAYVAQQYALLNSGSALGNKCGPLLVARQPCKLSEIDDLQIAIPGRYTTANFLLSIARPQATNKVPMLFSDIEEAVAQGTVDAGLIIHESRFTYKEKGLHKIADLGDHWESNTLLPIPLGGIAIHRSMDRALQQQVDALIKESVDYALQNSSEALAYAKQYAQEMDTNVMFQHIDLYVNNYTMDLEEKGRTAVRKMYDIAQDQSIIPPLPEDLFVEPAHLRYKTA